MRVALAPAVRARYDRHTCNIIIQAIVSGRVRYRVSLYAKKVAAVSRAHHTRDIQEPPLHKPKGLNAEAPGRVPGRLISSVLSVRPRGEGGHEGVVLCKSLVLWL